MYRVLAVDGDFHEVCDECGFHGGMWDLPAVVAAFRAMPDRWAALLQQNEALVRARPEPETYCAVEYAQHIIDAIAEIEWAARIFASGGTPNWDEMDEDSVPGVFDHEVHDCGRFDIAETLATLRNVCESMATYAASLTADEQGQVAVYAGDWVLNTVGVIRHALHDADHHVLDVRRGFARQALR